MKHKILSFSLLCLTFLSACSLLEPIKEDVSISLTTNTKLNPDAEGRSSPVVLRMYQLTTDKLFREKDFFEIFDEDKASLADSMVSKKELELNPNESRRLQLNLKPQTRYIGLMAAFRDLDNAKWQEVIKINPQIPTGIPVHEGQVFNVRLEDNKISLQQK